ncbi:hypothetical protein ACR776_20765 [Sphingobacterium spiritivorum]|uniref:hypothetical protein n=1 Tax=Sphingobacterium spiritivorum TaxID=258 RepID=UPI003DA69F3C
MKMRTAILISFIALVITSSLVSCSTTVKLGLSGKYNMKHVQSEEIGKNKVAIAINLFDIKTKDKIAIADVKNLPGIVIDSSSNYKLLLFDRDSLPRSIIVNKWGKMPLPLHPEKSKKNLLIIKVYLSKDTRGVI